MQEAGSPKGEGEVLDLPSESAGETSAEPSLGDQIRELKGKGGSDPDASDNIFTGALEEVGQGRAGGRAVAAALGGWVVW